MIRKEILTPAEVRNRLVIVSTPFKNVLEAAEHQNCKVLYYTNVTPFGTFPVDLGLVVPEYKTKK